MAVIKHFLRHAQEILVERAHDRHRVFHEVRHLVHEPAVLKHHPVLRLRQLLDLLHDAGLPHLGVDHHEVRLGLELIGLEVLDQEGAGAHEPVAARDVAALDAVQLELHHGPAGDGQDPVDGPGEPDVLVHPSHGLGERDGQDESRQHLTEPRRRVSALFVDAGNDVLALVRCLDAQGVHCHVVLLGEDERGLGGLAVGVKSDLLRRPDHFPGQVGLPLIQLRDVQDQAPRRAVGLDLARSTRRGRTRGAALNSSFIFSSAGLMNRGRDLLGADL